MSNTVQKWERERLRELAEKQLEYAESELNQTRIRGMVPAQRSEGRTSHGAAGDGDV